MQLKINYKEFERIALSSFEELSAEGELFEGKNGRYIFQNNGGSTLAVAHLDTVISHATTSHFSRLKYHGKTHVICAQVDNRAGAYVILSLLKQFLGDTYDILLTENEERGASTAEYFNPTNHGLEGKQYNWAFEFDRKGTDVVFYHLQTPEWRRAWEDANFKVGNGSYSDIASLELGCAAANIGVGYLTNPSYHSDLAMVNIGELASSVTKFLHFYEVNQSIAFPCSAKRYGRYTYSGGYKSYGDGEWSGGYKQTYNNKTKSWEGGGKKKKKKDKKDARPITFKWMDRPSTTTYKVLVSGDKEYLVYSYTMDNNETAQAVYCSQCNTPDWLENMDFADGMPVCDFCLNRRIELTTDQIDWLEQGGVLLKMVGRDMVRFPLPKDWNDAEKCPSCDNYTWKESLVRVENTDVCPYCAEIFYQYGLDIVPDEPKHDLPLLPDGLPDSKVPVEDIFDDGYDDDGGSVEKVKVSYIRCTYCKSHFIADADGSSWNICPDCSRELGG